MSASDTKTDNSKLVTTDTVYVSPDGGTTDEAQNICGNEHGQAHRYCFRVHLHLINKTTQIYPSVAGTLSAYLASAPPVLTTGILTVF